MFGMGKSQISTLPYWQGLGLTVSHEDIAHMTH